MHVCAYVCVCVYIQSHVCSSVLVTMSDVQKQIGKTVEVTSQIYSTILPRRAGGSTPGSVRGSELRHSVVSFSLRFVLSEEPVQIQFFARALLSRSRNSTKVTYTLIR